MNLSMNNFSKGWKVRAPIIAIALGVGVSGTALSGAGLAAPFAGLASTTQSQQIDDRSELAAPVQLAQNSDKKKRAEERAKKRKKKRERRRRFGSFS